MKIAIYSRKSKETDTGESIQNQINMCMSYFKSQYEDCEFEIFEDEGFSGSNINRPAFKRMMQLARHKQFNIVACYKIDRIGRNTLEFLTVYEELKEYDVKLVSITERFDPATPEGKMMMNMLSSIAEMERMNIAKRVKDNMVGLAKIGRWSGGTPPTGYRSITLENSNNKKETYLELIPEMEEKIKSIFIAASEGLTTFAIGKELGYSAKTIYNIITNPVYVQSTKESASYLEHLGYKVYGELNGNGFMPYNRRPRKNGKKLYNTNDRFVSVSTHKAIIEPNLWIRANDNIISRGQDARPRISTHSFLAHMVKCKCGSGMFVWQGKKDKSGNIIYYFMCSAKKKGSGCDSLTIRVNDVEESVLNELVKISLDKNILKYYIENKNKGIDYSKIIKNIKSDINKKTKEINSLTEKLILIEGPAVNIITDKINLISNELTKLNEELFKTEREKIFQEQDNINIDELHAAIVNLVNIFPTLNMEDKQFYIKKVIDHVDYNGIDSIKIKLN
ncbi:recombinase family protein [Clostridium sp. D53t1_180928_C8]|uniref:recombinase family protein n=1 Tax=Clostridium sp. D53t1_180928_C8 TaxID=2787101 RepID=UPI0018AC5A17|nr:recombinase family protein [Clostridium sp. D53t1_180928_C8]